MPRRLVLSLAVVVSLAGGCAPMPNGGRAGRDAAAVETFAVDDAEYPTTGRVAPDRYRPDPFESPWEVDMVRFDEETVRFDLRMKFFITGGEGEARQVFERRARRLAETEGFAGYDVIRYEEGIESSRPLARRVATGEVRLVRSRTWPRL